MRVGSIKKPMPSAGGLAILLAFYYCNRGIATDDYQRLCSQDILSDLYFASCRWRMDHWPDWFNR